MKLSVSSESVKKFIRNNGLRLWIIIVIMILGSMVAYAAYENEQNKTKKVIATSSDTEMRFSSNYLEEGTTKLKTTIKNASDPTITVYIRNYSKNNPTIWYTSDINYTLDFELSDTSGITSDNSNYQTRINSLLGTSEAVTITGNGSTVKLNRSTKTYQLTNQPLTYNRAASDQKKYVVTFPSVTSKICVRITATPTPEKKYLDLKPISVILTIADKDNLQVNGWEGKFNDAQTNKTPSDYDAYNYCLTGHGSSTNAVFKWDSSRLEVNNQYFQSKFDVDITSADEAPEEGANWKKVTIEVDSSKSNGRYDFQLFKANSTVSFSTWNALEDCVKFDDGID